ncbi:hypothetical protein CBP51_00710 [Cellvibrio mixtus]|uniref:Inner membrane protein n=1 Tax=Cellvibrio mixtus TaxID=39650 RepID=A0A266Q6U0_9GAMM|nr:YbaN family protein [Cellvibrio mixtus]OZY85607.1 hypothetical protein CBP51_00710 [Cellvibrio mixtus]
MMKWLWRSLALIALILGFIGVIVPGMPTTVFMLMAAGAASRGWPALHDWLLRHPRFGPPIHHWRDHGAVPRKAKWLALATMLLSMWMICASPSALWVKWCIPSFMTLILIWLWTRPEIKSIATEHHH